MTGTVWKFRPQDHKTAHHGHARNIRFGPRACEILEPLIRPDVQGFIIRPADSMEWSNQQQAARANPKSKPTPSRLARKRKGKEHAEFYDPTTYGRAIARVCLLAFPLPADLTCVKVAAVKSNGRKFKRWETPAEWQTRLGPEKWKQAQNWKRDHQWHPHQLRHSAATAFRRDADFESAKILLGHSSDSMTQQYAKRDEAKADAPILKIG